MTTDNNENGDHSMNEPSKALPIPLAISTTHPLEAPSILSTSNFLPSVNVSKSDMAASSSAVPVLTDSNSIEISPNIERLQAGRTLPDKAKTPSLSSTPPSVSPSLSSAFKIVPQRQKLHGEITDGRLTSNI